jgi:membrane protease YdiL (CAAX protease family)
MNKLIKDYLLITFLIVIIFWGTLIVFSINGIILKDKPLLYVPYLIGGWSPTIASYISLKKNNQIEGFKDWLKHIFDFKHNLLSYLMVIFLAVLYILPQIFISGYKSGFPLYAIVIMIPIMLFCGGLEEAGWRYVLQSELEKKHNFLLSTLVVSVIWWIWHLPLFFIQGVAQYGHNYFAFGLSLLGVSFSLASIRKNTNSVFLCVLFHCIVNSLGSIYKINENIIGNLVTSIILVIMSLVLVIINSKKKFFN